MIDAPCRRGHTDEHAPGEEASGDKLQPQPGGAELARDDIAKHRERKARDRNAAQYHEQMLKRVQRLPFEVAMTRNNKGQLWRGGRGKIMGRGGAVRRGLRPWPASPCLRHLMLRTSSRIFTACGPRSLASWSWIGCAALAKPDLSTPSTTFTPIFFSFSAESASSWSALAGSVLATSSAAAWTHCFSWSLRLFQVLSLTQMQLLLASCSVRDRIGATS